MSDTTEMIVFLYLCTGLVRVILTMATAPAWLGTAYVLSVRGGTSRTGAKVHAVGFALSVVLVNLLVWPFVLWFEGLMSFLTVERNFTAMRQIVVAHRIVLKSISR